MYPYFIHICTSIEFSVSVLPHDRVSDLITFEDNSPINKKYNKELYFEAGDTDMQ